MRGADSTRMTITYFILALISGFVCAAIAATRNRSTLGWFVIGFLISLVGFIMVLVIPDLSKDRADPRDGARFQALERLARLAELQSAGVLTDLEFSVKKTELLALV